ncbi:MAG: energy-coupling factor transporter ATPase [Ruminococcaceae bacterium]|nr:energy-coupling factor transporter ATPase [Oscillospiraceae bacterium]
MSAIIDIQSLSFRYEEDRPDVISDIELKIEKGEFVALLGHNGCGKSTLAKHLNAILLPSGGRVLVGGIDTADDDSLLMLRSMVGMVFQNPDNQMVAAIVEEDVAFGPENLGVRNPELRQRVDNALKAVGMYDYRRHAPHKLSGGQKQRVAIAGILAMQPQCIVLDEPTAMLDPAGRQEVMDAIIELCRTQGVTIVLITHYMDEAARADRVVAMDKGKILIQGTPAEVFSHVELLREHRLDVPQPVELADMLRKSGFPMPEGILTPEDCAKAIAAILEKK